MCVSKSRHLRLRKPVKNHKAASYKTQLIAFIQKKFLKKC